MAGIRVVLLADGGVELLERQYLEEMGRRIGEQAAVLKTDAAPALAAFRAAHDELVAELEAYAKTLPRSPNGDRP